MLNPNEEEDESNDYFPQKYNFYFHDFTLLNDYIKSNDHPKQLKEDNDKDNSNSLNQSYARYTQNISCNILNPFEFLNSISRNTKLNSIDCFTGKKRKYVKNNGDNESISFNEKIEDKNLDDNSNNKKMGRRLKDEIYNTEAKHGKFGEDNIIIKIKTFIFKYILAHLNDSLEVSKNKFYPLNKRLNQNIKRDFNIELLDRTIYDIYITEDLNKNYKNANNSNKILIKRILEENIEKKTIKILNMKFRDVLNHIREKDLENFLEKIKGKEKKNKGKSIDLYMEHVIHFLNEFENWFKIKNGRNVGKKIKK